VSSLIPCLARCSGYGIQPDSLSGNTLMLYQVKPFYGELRSQRCMVGMVASAPRFAWQEFFPAHPAL